MFVFCTLILFIFIIFKIVKMAYNTNASASSNNLEAVKYVVQVEDFMKKQREFVFKKSLRDINKRMAALEDENKLLKNELQTLREAVSDSEFFSGIKRNVANKLINIHQTQLKSRSQKFMYKSASKQILLNSTLTMKKNLEGLLNQIRSLSIKTEEQLYCLIDILFDKAIEDSNFITPFAILSKELALLQVPTKVKGKKQFVNFRQLLITNCQINFENRWINENNSRNLRLEEINECIDPEKKKELQLLFEKDDRRMQIEAIGNIRIIGELFKQQMITVKIILKCINKLLENKDENSLECLCTLLITVGKYLELTKCQNLQPYFQIMQEIVEIRHENISSRIRLMLLDVIVLRKNKWIPRIQNDTELNSQPMITSQKDSHICSVSDRRRNNSTDDIGWSMNNEDSQEQEPGITPALVYAADGPSNDQSNVDQFLRIQNIIEEYFNFLKEEQTPMDDSWK